MTHFIDNIELVKIGSEADIIDKRISFGKVTISEDKGLTIDFNKALGIEKASEITDTLNDWYSRPDEELFGEYYIYLN